MNMVKMCKEENLMELKKMLIGCKILKEISWGVWRDYCKKISWNWICEEGLNILLSDELIEMMKDKNEKEVKNIFKDFINSSTMRSRAVQSSLVQLCRSMSDRVYSNGSQWNRHRVLCWAAGWMVENCRNDLSEETYQCLSEFSVNLIEQCDDMETVNCAILTVERLCFKTTFLSSTKCQLVSALRSQASYISQVNIASDFEHLDLRKYQVGWCARWIIDHVLGDEGLRKKERLPLVKLSRDQCEVRNDNDWCIPVRSSFSVTSGVYYYEAITMTNGKIRFGWSTREAKLNSWNSWNLWTKIGDDKHSIGLEVTKACHIYHRKNRYISNKFSCQSVNVIGCLIDVNNRQFVFYLNGQKIEWQGVIHFSSLPYYATANLSSHQHCIFNFGQIPFMFPPTDIEFNQTNENMQKYQLTETFEYRNYFWYAHSPNSSNVDPVYCDPVQDECDELVRQLELIEHNQNTRLDLLEYCRLVQSVIEMNKKLTSCHVDLLTIRITKAKESEKAKLMELLNRYYQLSVNSVNIKKCTNISTVLILLLLSSEYHLKEFQKYIVRNFHLLDTFLSQTIQAFNLFLNPKIVITDPLKMINMFKKIESLHLPITTQSLLNDPSIRSTLNWCSELFGQVSNVSRLYEPSCDMARLQVGVCARWFRDHVIQGKEQNFPSQSTLNSEDKEEYIKLSSDCLSARNAIGRDNHYFSFYWDGWQSVFSVCSVSSYIFYYEAVLITDGKMRIGWATKQSKLINKGIGSDKYSIGFDGRFGNDITHQGRNFCDNSLISNFTSKSPWSVGDVVGCLIDCDKKIFKFYLNGKLVKCKEKFKPKRTHYLEYFICFSDEPYHASVSLQPNQQCYLNLGQCHFRYPPSVPFRTFYHVSPTTPTTPLYSPRLSECYSLVKVLVKDQIDLVFDDDKQKESDQLANEFIGSISKNNFPVYPKTLVDRLRFLQSLISVSGSRLLDYGISDHASLIAHFTTQSSSDDPAFPDLVAQLLYPFFELHLTNDTVIKHRNVCFVLASLVSVMEDVKARAIFYQQVFTYITQILLKNDDEWTLLFVTICLGNMNLEEVNKQTVHLNCTIMNKLNNILVKSSVNQNSFLFQQTHFCLEWFFRNTLKTIEPSPILSNKTTLNEFDRSKHLKLSPDLLTARSDWQWQSVRSVNSVKQIVYYEVTLQTSGSMRIGWATKRTDLQTYLVGSDEYSIGFDGYERSIWHENKRYPIKDIEQWKAGDVIGCFLGHNHFSFQHNHKTIPAPSLVYFSTKAYFAAVSLFSFQQCTFNFTKTKFFPKRTEFTHFDSIRHIRNSYIKVKKSIQEGSSITNSIILQGSKLIANNIQITSNVPVPSFSSNTSYSPVTTIEDQNKTHESID